MLKLFFFFLHQLHGIQRELESFVNKFDAKAFRPLQIQAWECSIKCAKAPSSAPEFQQWRVPLPGGAIMSLPLCLIALLAPPLQRQQMPRARVDRGASPHR